MRKEEKCDNTDTVDMEDPSFAEEEYDEELDLTLARYLNDGQPATPDEIRQRIAKEEAKLQALIRDFLLPDPAPLPAELELKLREAQAQKSETEDAPPIIAFLVNENGQATTPKPEVKPMTPVITVPRIFTARTEFPGTPTKNFVPGPPPIVIPPKHNQV